MAVPNKTAKSFLVFGATNLTAAATTTYTWDLTKAFGGYLTIRIVNQGTGPTTAPTVTINVSNDNAAWRPQWKFTGVITASNTSDWGVEIPAGVMYVQVSITAGATTAQGGEVQGHELSNIY